MIARRVVLAALMLLLQPASIDAQSLPSPSPMPELSPSASPSPVATPVGFSSRAHATIVVSSPRGPIRLIARVAAERNGDRTRFDIRSIEGPPLPFRFDGISVVVDARSQKLIAWNRSNQTFFTQSLVPSVPTTPAATSPQRGTQRERSPIADLDLLSLDVRLGSRRLIVGLPSTALNVVAQTRRRGTSRITRLTGSVNMADDFAFFPLAVAMTAWQGKVATFKLSYALDTLERVVPPESDFAVPAGYRLASSIFAVILGLPDTATPPLSPSPAPSQTPGS